MPYDENIAARVRTALKSRKDVVEKSMFGGITFMVAGNMCCGVHRDDLILRLNSAKKLEELGNSHARVWDFMKRPMPGMFAIGAAGCARQESVDRLVRMALEHALSLPPKGASKAKPRRSARR